MSLGFILFLLSSYKLLRESALNVQDRKLGFKPTFVAVNVYALKPSRVEPILFKYKDLIEEFSWITYDVDDISYIDRTDMKDPSR